MNERIRAALRDANWAEISARLTDYAERRLRGRSQFSAADAAQSAIAKVLGGTYAWDAERVPDLDEHLRHVVNSIVANETRTYGERVRKGGEAALAAAENGESSPESTAHNRQVLALCAAEIRAQFGAKGTIYLAVAGDTPGEQATALGLDVKAVYRLRQSAVARCRRMFPNARTHRIAASGG
jgi:DNA-directed RNA polymerase specialized sigma24 family protein